MSKFKALFVERKKNSQILNYSEITKNDLPYADTLVRISFSTINYKDGLAITGKGPILKKWPMIPGVDFSGVVEETTHRNLKKGDEVILNGNGVGEKYFGGFSQKARVNGDWLIKLPKPITLSESMSIGSAGLTSMLCVSEIQKQMQPSDGKVLVTGASGGVGSIAVIATSPDPSELERDWSEIGSKIGSARSAGGARGRHDGPSGFSAGFGPPHYGAL